MTSSARYKAVRRLARGAFVEVLVAKDTQHNDALVVVKRILPDLALDKELIALFEREIAIARKLEHPNIVRILDVGRVGSAPFYVMEHLEGADLRVVLLDHRKHGTQIPVATACFIGAAMARGLGHAHRVTSIVHRDIKPANVFICRDGIVKLLDFGIATSAEHVALTRTGVARGTRAYMAPEQLGGLRIDMRADVFALGVVLWETLTSRRLFKRDTDDATVNAIHNEPPPPPSAHAKGIPARVEAIVMAMLSKLPATRPADAWLVADVLEAEARKIDASDGRAAIARLLAAGGSGGGKAHAPKSR